MQTWQERKQVLIRNYRRRRRALIRKLGGKCVHCGATRKFQFHHKTERTWIASRTSRWSRIAKYEREAEAKQIELACKKCNQRLGKPPAHTRTTCPKCGFDNDTRGPACSSCIEF